MYIKQWPLEWDLVFFALELSERAKKKVGQQQVRLVWVQTRCISIRDNRTVVRVMNSKSLK